MHACPNVLGAFTAVRSFAIDPVVVISCFVGILRPSENQLRAPRTPFTRTTSSARATTPICMETSNTRGMMRGLHGPWTR